MVSEHLPECMWPQTEFPCKQCWEIDCECTCICGRLRACEDRLTAAALQRVAALVSTADSGWTYVNLVWRAEAIAAIKRASHD